MRHITQVAVAAGLLLLSPPLFAHHGDFYKKVFAAVKQADFAEIKNLFSRGAWEGTAGAMSAKELQERLKRGRVRGLFENSQHDDQRSKCLVAFKLEYPDKTVEPIWLLAEDLDPRYREWDWRIVQIINREREAQAFFKHSYSLEFSRIEVGEEKVAPATMPRKIAPPEAVPGLCHRRVKQ